MCIQGEVQILEKSLSDQLPTLWRQSLRVDPSFRSVHFWGIIRRRWFYLFSLSLFVSECLFVNSGIELEFCTILLKSVIWSYKKRRSLSQDRLPPLMFPSHSQPPVLPAWSVFPLITVTHTHCTHFCIFEVLFLFWFVLLNYFPFFF